MCGNFYFKYFCIFFFSFNILIVVVFEFVRENLDIIVGENEYKNELYGSYFENFFIVIN